MRGIYLEQRDIIIITDFEEGHFYPLLSLAQDFEKSGYTFYFIGILDTAEIIDKNGFECITVFQNLFPKGYVRRLKDNKISSKSISSNDYMKLLFDEFDKFIPIVQPKIIFSSLFFSLISLLCHYKFGIKQVIYHTFFLPLSEKPRLSLGQICAQYAAKSFMELESSFASYLLSFLESKNLNFDTFNDMMIPFETMPQIVLCPRELDINRSYPNENEIHTGPCIYKSRNERNLSFFNENLLKIRKDKIIYASMGSQTKEYPEKAERFFNVIIKTMKSDSLKDFHLILSLGSDIKLWNLSKPPENVEIHNWVPQIEILKMSSIAIIHGGLGSIKECIYYGVPMLIVPMGRDQLDNAERVEHHRIGFSTGFNVISEEHLQTFLIKLFNDNAIREHILKMQSIFHESERQNTTAKLVQNLLRIPD